MKASPAAKVAVGATAVIAVIYIIGVIVLNVLVSTHLTEQNDDHLSGRLAAAAHDRSMVSERVGGGDGPGSARGRAATGPGDPARRATPWGRPPARRVPAARTLGRQPRPSQPSAVAGGGTGRPPATDQPGTGVRPAVSKIRA